MTKKTLISLVSAQTIPNVFFIKAFPEFDEFVFLRTDEMEKSGKSSFIISAIKIKKERCRIIAIYAENYQASISKLKAEFSSKSTKMKFVVNLTGGTKLMALVVFDFFKKFSNSEVFYIPLQSSKLHQIHPVVKEIEFERYPEIDLKTYFAAHGFDFLASYKPEHSLNRSQDIFEELLDKGNVTQIPEVIRAYSKSYKGGEERYLKGIWFEEYIYWSLKRDLNITGENICFNLKMREMNSPQETESDNELDVAFMYKNSLYILECKVYLSQMKKRIDMSKIQDPMFKIASVRRNLGLSANCIVAFAANIGYYGKRMARLQQLERLLGIHKILDLTSFSNERDFKNLLNI